MPKPKSGAPQIKQIKLDPAALSFGSSHTRKNGKQHQTRELPFRSRKKERNTSQRNGKQGMKRSEIMRQIRNNLLAKKRDALSKSNPSNNPTHPNDSISDTPSAALSHSALSRTKRKLRKNSGNSSGIFSTSKKHKSPIAPIRKEPANSTQNAIEFFELKKKELSLQKSNNSLSNTNVNTNPINSLGTSLLNHDSPTHNTNTHNTSNDNRHTSIHLNIPTTLANASPKFKSISPSSNSYNINASTNASTNSPKSILKKNTNYPNPYPLNTYSSSSQSRNLVDHDQPHDQPSYNSNNINPIRIDSDETNDSDPLTSSFDNHRPEIEENSNENDFDNIPDFNLNTQSSPPNTRELRRGKKKRHRRSRIERRKTYRLGKNENKDGLSVMIYGNKTRKKLKDEHENFNEGDVSKMRRVLRHRCLLKTGSTAPPNLIREMYKNTRLFGDVLAKCNANEATEYLELND